MEHGAASRYARQQVFPGVGVAGQARLAAARVGMVGCGALGTHLADQLVRAGVGTLIIIDRDIVEWSNLQRQSLFDEADAANGTPKALAAAARLRQINQSITIVPRVQDFGADEARDLAAEVDLVLDGTDAFETRYLMNDACVAADIPWIYCAVVGATGVTLNCHVPISGGHTPCLRCVWPEPAVPGTAETCDTAGVLNGAVSAITGLAATEALKILLGAPTISQDLRSFDLWENIQEALAVPRDPDCPCCGQHAFPWLNDARDYVATMLCGRDTVQVRPATRVPVALADLAQRWCLAGVVEFPEAQAFVRLRLGDQDITVFPDGRALVRGVHDVAAARTLYARYVGI